MDKKNTVCTLYGHTINNTKITYKKNEKKKRKIKKQKQSTTQ